MSKVSIGTVISGTMRERDLVPAFLDALRDLNPEAADQFTQDNPDVFTDDGIVMVEDIDLVMDDLYEAINKECPEGIYFGAHPGDGADYGFWSTEGL